MRYKDEDIQNVIDNLDIVQVVGEYVDLKRAGHSYKGLCPFHKEKNTVFFCKSSKERI